MFKYIRFGCCEPLKRRRLSEGLRGLAQSRERQKIAGESFSTNPRGAWQH